MYSCSAKRTSRASCRATNELALLQLAERTIELSLIRFAIIKVARTRCWKMRPITEALCSVCSVRIRVDRARLKTPCSVSGTSTDCSSRWRWRGRFHHENNESRSERSNSSRKNGLPSARSKSSHAFFGQILDFQKLPDERVACGLVSGESSIHRKFAPCSRESWMTVDARDCQSGAQPTRQLAALLA